ncbi:hypothetical protein QL285_054000 [Trifolium repens]|nr:hypothetical protein QL285_054000 [Trifolium repens]
MSSSTFIGIHSSCVSKLNLNSLRGTSLQSLLPFLLTFPSESMRLSASPYNSYYLLTFLLTYNVNPSFCNYLVNVINSTKLQLGLSHRSTNLQLSSSTTA